MEPDKQTPKPDLKPAVDTGRAHAPPLGTRIQVLWRIVYDEASNPPAEQDATSAPAQSMETATEAPSGEHPQVVERWWGAVVQDCTSQTVGSRDPIHQQQRVFILLYDSYGEFEEDTSHVAFLPDNVLLDLSMLHEPTAGRLDWRLESEQSEHSELPDPTLASPVRIASLAREAEDIVNQSGLPADADLHALATMPQNVQLRVASGYRSFADAVKTSLGELVASKPTDYVITADDVHTIMARVRNQQRQQNPLAGSAL